MSRRSSSVRSCAAGVCPESSAITGSMLPPHKDQNRYNFNGEADTSIVYEETKLCLESSRSPVGQGCPSPAKGGIRMNPHP